MIAYCRVRRILFFLTFPIIFFVSSLTYAQSPVVYGVFFYSPTCPHCQDVINNHWPAIQNEFGDQLRVLFINATTPQGGQIMMDAVVALGTQERGVPMLIIGSEVLVGSIDIPARTPGIIRAGLDAGGIGLPAIPGIEALYQTALEQTSQTQPEAQAGAFAESASAESAPAEGTLAEAEQTPTFIQRLAADPLANGLAVLILGLLVLSFGIAIRLFWKKPSHNDAIRTKRYQQIALAFTALLGLGMSLSLLAGSNQNPTVLLLASGEALIFLVVAASSLRTPLERTLPRWLVPLMAVGGLGVAGYLTFIEITPTAAVCGVVGDCSTVQQSAYASVLNIPVGILGIGAYILILMIWLLSREGKFQPWANWLVRDMVLLGVVFSIYLTFLEPFVIGATCIWCLTSAVVMLMLLWLLTPPVPEYPRHTSDVGIRQTA